MSRRSRHHSHTFYHLKQAARKASPALQRERDCGWGGGGNCGVVGRQVVGKNGGGRVGVGHQPHHLHRPCPSKRPAGRKEKSPVPLLTSRLQGAQMGKGNKVQVLLLLLSFPFPWNPSIILSRRNDPVPSKPSIPSQSEGREN